ncbi:hypothetical protein DX116_17225 [Aeromicrobium endophyticum]|uniref:Uncharacterized protein n=1 Tax=Aeromicrobium endophyticum TaxID=2292704 RepID=A0A371P4F8_9ACTN|nr:hypothetical protein DX116_17225 [Aeromicrobium endophyticum]
MLAGLVLAFTTVPALVAGALHGSRDISSLKTALGDDLVAYTRAGRSSFGADLAELTGYWRAWHASKIVICALALMALAMLARDLWRRYEHGTAVASVRWAATGVTVLVPLVAVALAANIQSTAAPSVALLQLVPRDAGGALGTALTEVQRQVLASPDSAGWSRPVQHLAHDVRVYHLVMVVVVGAVVVASAATAAHTWRHRRAGTASRERRTMLTTTGVVAAVSAVALTLLLVSEVQGVLDPGAALLDVIGRG